MSIANCAVGTRSGNLRSSNGVRTHKLFRLLQVQGRLGRGFLDHVYYKFKMPGTIYVLWDIFENFLISISKNA